MNNGTLFRSPLGRTVGGLFAGSVFGLIAELLIFRDNSKPEPALPLIGPLIGACLMSVLGLFIGGRVVGGWSRILAVAVLGGVCVGAIGGALVYAPIMAHLDRDADGSLNNKVRGWHQREGVILGIPAGAIGGLLVGLFVAIRNRKTTNRSSLFDDNSPEKASSEHIEVPS